MNEDFDFFDLDKHKLVEELERQPKLYFEHAEKLADARRDLERAEADKDLVWAELDKDVRSDPASFGLEKVTEGSLEQAIIRHKRYRQAAEDCIERKHEADVLQAAVNGLEHRKRALEGLLQLAINEFYALPKIPQEHKDAKADAAFGKKRKKRVDRDDD